MAFYYPAYSAWLPALVEERDLLAVNGFEGMIRPTIGQAIGPGVAGVVVGAISPGAAFSIAAVASPGRADRPDGRAADARAPGRRPRGGAGGIRSRAALIDVREGFGCMVRDRRGCWPRCSSRRCWCS